MKKALIGLIVLAAIIAAGIYVYGNSSYLQGRFGKIQNSMEGEETREFRPTNSMEAEETRE